MSVCSFVIGCGHESNYTYFEHAESIKGIFKCVFCCFCIIWENSKLSFLCWTFVLSEHLFDYLVAFVPAGTVFVSKYSKLKGKLVVWRRTGCSFSYTCIFKISNVKM